MKIGLNLHQAPRLLQTMQLILNPRMLALLKTLQLPYAELITSINKEVEENPLLEIEKPDELLEYAKGLRQSAPSVRKEADYDPLAPDKDIQSAAQTLADYLIGQLRLENLDESDQRIGEYLINSLDERGFLPDYPGIRTAAMRALNVKKCNVDKILEVIQTLEPEGVGARDLKECLLIQIEAYNFESEELREVLKKAVRDHLDDLAKKNFQKVAQKFEITREGAEALALFIEKNLRPDPASGYRSESSVNYIIPSFIVEKTEQGVYRTVNLEETKGPQLGFNQSYLKLLEDPKTDPETLGFIRQKFEAAKLFLENIRSRKDTIQKIINIVSATQEEFFEKGVFLIRPLMQKELAQRIGVHPSTISRAISTKYVQTPQGLYPMKFLCPRNFSGYSPIQIKGIVKSLATENPEISDQKICEVLQGRGIDIKRRTVTKYRQELGITSSYRR